MLRNNAHYFFVALLLVAFSFVPGIQGGFFYPNERSSDNPVSYTHFYQVLLNCYNYNNILFNILLVYIIIFFTINMLDWHWGYP